MNRFGRIPASRKSHHNTQTINKIEWSCLVKKRTFLVLTFRTESFIMATGCHGSIGLSFILSLSPGAQRFRFKAPSLLLQSLMNTPNHVIGLLTAQEESKKKLGPPSEPIHLPPDSTAVLGNLLSPFFAPFCTIWSPPRST